MGCKDKPLYFRLGHGHVVLINNKYMVTYVYVKVYDIIELGQLSALGKSEGLVL